VDKLGINLSQLIAQIINFGILFTALYFIAFKWFFRKMDERQQRIKEGMEQAEFAKQQATQAEGEIKKQLEAARRDGQEIVNRAMHTGEELVQKAQQDARTAAEAIKAREMEQILQEREQAIGEIRQEFGDLTIAAAGKVIDRSLDKKDHREIIEQVLNEGLKRGSQN
jgi:F-type H+-transporting ATPase subunit b